MKSYKTSRREFIKICSLSASGLFLVSFIPIGCSDVNDNPNPNILTPSAYLRIDTNGIVTIFVHRSEMGQGVKTAIPMIIAEELEIDWKSIVIEQADAGEKYGNQLTMGSTSIRQSYTPFRIAGATAKEMLITAASLKWNVDISNCFVSEGFIYNKVNNEKIAFGELVLEAAKLPIPQNVKLKDPKEYKIIGKRIKRVDTPDKIYGIAKFGIDIVVPGMVYAAVKRSPTFGGSVKSYNSKKLEQIEGILEVVQISNGIAVVADSTWNAFKGVELLEVEWLPGPNKNVDSESIRKSFSEKLDSEGIEVIKVGNTDYSEFKNGVTINSVYELPFQAHAPMEPVNCVAYVQNDRAEIWAPTQDPQKMQADIARKIGFKNLFDRIFGFKGKDVIVHVTYLGGGFGRKSNSDFGIEAAEISQAISKPVKLTWTREDDIKYGQFRPASMHSLKGAIDESGKVSYLSHHIIGPSIKASLRKKEPTMLEDIDDMVAKNSIYYNIPNAKISATNVTTPVPLWYWRAVYNSQNPFAVESFIDEMAIKANQDPIDFRLEMLNTNSRMENVLRLVREKSDWDKNLPPGKGRGVALFSGYGSFNAQVAEVTIQNNKLKIDRVVSVIDCGIIINPDGVEAQMEGAIIFGLTAALKGEITIKKGGVENSNFYDYPLLEYNETPIIETYQVQNDHPVGGVGEVGVAASAPAIANAIYNATGVRLRKLPINEFRL